MQQAEKNMGTDGTLLKQSVIQSISKEHIYVASKALELLFFICQIYKAFLPFDGKWPDAIRAGTLVTQTAFAENRLPPLRPLAAFVFFFLNLAHCSELETRRACEAALSFTTSQFP